ncbi:DUF2163 domain-containing protein [Massilia sp. P8910]|uniref:DUF2163 domain-containing protein n=1 Tax=Massilia antarctica TaxID=2765360 RepID=UPI001E449729|nr:DUF2163 domain-containing protein [Massilia antarctica]MCE3608079.1 DUF2163 domain-containing protein [Massilia antarctica]
MPKLTPPALIAHMRGNTPSNCTLWKVDFPDGRKLSFTDSDVDIVYDDGTGGRVFTSKTGFNPSAIESTSNLSVDNSEVAGVKDDEFIREADVRAGIWDGAEVWVYRVNPKDLTMGHEILNRGTIGNITTGRDDIQVEVRGFSQRLQQQSNHIVAPHCTAFLGDSRCKINLASYTFPGTVTSVLSNQSFGTDLVKPVAYFAKGLVHWLTGANAGLRKDVKFFSGRPSLSTIKHTAEIVDGAVSVPIPTGKTFAQDYGVVDSDGLTYEQSETPSSSGSYQPTSTGLYNFNTADNGTKVTITYSVEEYVESSAGQIDLMLEMPYPIAIGDTFKAVAGCDKLRPTCKSKFGNVINMRAFPDLPGLDALISGKK